jgi:hypothetical protein
MHHRVYAPADRPVGLAGRHGAPVGVFKLGHCCQKRRKVSLGAVRPSSEDFAMLRLVLLVLLPQMGGLLIMVGRQSAS